jgi:hypothetical protein
MELFEIDDRYRGHWERKREEGEGGKERDV